MKESLTYQAILKEGEEKGREEGERTMLFLVAERGSGLRISELAPRSSHYVVEKLERWLASV